MKNKPYFSNIEGKGALWFDVSLVEANYPVLFTCYDIQKQPYLCACINVQKNHAEWIVAETNLGTLKNLLSNKITIRESLCVNDSVYFIERTDGTVEVTKVDYKKLPENYLPTAGEYMDADEGEFDYELAHFEEVYSEQIITLKHLHYIFKETILNCVVDYARTNTILNSYSSSDTESILYDKQFFKPFERKVVSA